MGNKKKLQKQPLVMEMVRSFIVTHEPGEVRNRFIRIIFDYIARTCEDQFPKGFDQFITDFWEVLEILEQAEVDRPVFLKTI